MDNIGGSNQNLEKSRLQSVVLDYKKTQKLTKCGLIAIAVILILLLIFITSGWSNYRSNLAAKQASASADGKDGKDGNTPYIGENGNWFIGDKDTGISAKGDDGADGQDGEDGIGQSGATGAAGAMGNTGDDGADGKDGLTPYIGENGNWFIGDKDTGIPATGGASGGGTGNTSPGDGSFTVHLDSKNGNKSIAVSETYGFANPTDHLETNGLSNAWNIAFSSVPVGNAIDTKYGGGSNNGHNYFAYTFFLKNTGTETLDYNELHSLVQNNRNAVKALRYMVYRNGNPVIYASPAADGSKEPDACDEMFQGEVNLISKDRTALEPGQIDRYTIVAWFEGNDPECVNNILGGSVKLSLSFKIL